MRDHRQFENVDKLERRLFRQTQTQQYRQRRRYPSLGQVGLWESPAATAARQVAVIGAVSLIKLIV